MSPCIAQTCVHCSSLHSYHPATHHPHAAHLTADNACRAGPKRAYTRVLKSETEYIELPLEVLADAATGTVTLTALARCSATFKLTAGYAFDMSPPANATCPAGTTTVTSGTRKLCKLA
jgi:hypothetical protein